MTTLQNDFRCAGARNPEGCVPPLGTLPGAAPTLPLFFTTILPYSAREK